MDSRNYVAMVQTVRVQVFCRFILSKFVTRLHSCGKLKKIRSPNFTDYIRCVHRDGSISSGKNVIRLGSFECDFEIKSRPPILQDK